MSTGADQATHERRSDRKRRAIIEAATASFLEHGYRGTSMDTVAANAGVSKQTVYQHFGDKERLFRELVAATVQTASDPVYDEVHRLADSGRLDRDLRDLARRLLALVLRPAMMRLRRLVIAEARQFPDLGRVFYDLGPGRTIAALAETFAELTRQGRLNAPDATLAATQFNWLIMSVPLNRAMLLGQDDTPPAREINRWADSGVRTFLAAYGDPVPTGRPQSSGDAAPRQAPSIAGQVEAIADSCGRPGHVDGATALFAASRHRGIPGAAATA